MNIFFVHLRYKWSIEGTNTNDPFSKIGQTNNENWTNEVDVRREFSICPSVEGTKCEQEATSS